MMLLRYKDRKTLVQIFETMELPIEVWAYGSRVNGSAHEGSDLDLVVRGAGLAPLPMFVLANLIQQIRESNIPILVELRDWARLPPGFHRNIEQQYEVLFKPAPVMVSEPNAEYKGKQSRTK